MCRATSEAHIGTMQTTSYNSDLTSFLVADRAAHLRADADRQRMLRRLTRRMRRNSLSSA
jgi:hypothetical protein